MMKFKSLFLMVLAVFATGGCWGGMPERPMSQKLGWKPADFFTDPLVVKLCSAIEANDLEEMQRLIEAGADVDAHGKGNNTPLLWAFFDNHPERFRLLLENGADPNVVISEDLDRRGIVPAGTSVTHMAAASWFPQHFELVMKHGGDPHLLNHEKRTPLYSVITGTSTDKIKRVQLLIDSGADLNFRSERSNFTAVSKAVSWFGQYDLALFMLESGADPTVYYPDSNSKLVHTVLSERTRMRDWSPEKKAEYEALVKWLKDHGEDFEKAQEDLDRWHSWGQNLPQEIGRLRRAEIAERLAREQAEKKENPPAEELPEEKRGQ